MEYCAPHLFFKFSIHIFIVNDFKEIECGLPYGIAWLLTYNALFQVSTVVILYSQIAYYTDCLIVSDDTSQSK